MELPDVELCTLGLEFMDYFNSIQSALVVYHLPSLSSVPKLSTRVRLVSVGCFIPIGAYFRPLSMRDQHGTYHNSHLRVSFIGRSVK